MFQTTNQWLYFKVWSIAGGRVQGSWSSKHLQLHGRDTHQTPKEWLPKTLTFQTCLFVASSSFHLTMQKARKHPMLSIVSSWCHDYPSKYPHDYSIPLWLLKIRAMPLNYPQVLGHSAWQTKPPCRGTRANFSGLLAAYPPRCCDGSWWISVVPIVITMPPRQSSTLGELHNDRGW